MFEMHGGSWYWQTSPPGMFIVPLIQETVKSQAVVHLNAGLCRKGPKLAAQLSANRLFAIFEGRRRGKLK